MPGLGTFSRTCRTFQLQVCWLTGSAEASSPILLCQAVRTRAGRPVVAVAARNSRSADPPMRDGGRGEPRRIRPDCRKSGKIDSSDRSVARPLRPPPGDMCAIHDRAVVAFVRQIRWYGCPPQRADNGARVHGTTRPT